MKKVNGPWQGVRFSVAEPQWWTSVNEDVRWWVSQKKICIKTAISTALCSTSALGRICVFIYSPECKDLQPWVERRKNSYLDKLLERTRVQGLGFDFGQNKSFFQDSGQTDDNSSGVGKCETCTQPLWMIYIFNTRVKHNEETLKKKRFQVFSSEEVCRVIRGDPGETEQSWVRRGAEQAASPSVTSPDTQRALQPGWEPQ